jgi:hypothetical protein
MTVNEVIVAFLRHAENHYRRTDGTSTNELNEYRYSLQPVRSLYGITSAAEFGPLALKAVRELMIRADWSRKVINQRIGRIKRKFKWAVSEELIPPAVFHGLATIPGLQRGSTSWPLLSEPIKAGIMAMARVISG